MDYEVVILPSFSQVEAWRKREARLRGSGLFAQVVTTFDAWIADLWELHGDGRALVDGVRREVMLRALCQQAGGALATPGVAPMAASCMRQAAGLEAFERALDAVRRGEPVEGVSEGERAFLEVLARYDELLAERGFVEPGEAAAALGRKSASVFPRPMKVLFASAPELTWIQDAFLAACPQLQAEVCPAPGAGGIPKAPEGVEVRFAFPSGPLAEPALIADLVRERGAYGDVVVACKDPVKLFGQIERPLSEAGYVVCVRGSKRFADTDFGRAFLAMFHCLHDDPWDPALLVDVLHSPFSGVPRRKAWGIDKELRSNRLVDREEVIARLRAEHEPFSQLEELASDPDADVLVGAFEQMVQSFQHRSPSWRAEQLASMRRLKSATDAARGIGAGIEVCAGVLERASVPVSAQVGATGPSVIVESQAAAAQWAAGSCTTLVVADLTSQDYPVAERDDAVKTLLAKVGLASKGNALSQARRTFTSLLSLPTGRIVLVRPLGDANAGEAYASAVLEEFIDAYRDDPSATEDIDNAFRLPVELQDGLVERGEELLYANAVAGSGDAEQQIAATPALVSIEDLVPCGASEVIPPRRDEDGNPVAFVPSASQIETYLECPFRWFASKRLGLEEFSEGFGPREQGSFAHEAIETFYRRFQESGQAKVNDENLEDARALMREVVAELERDQLGRDPGKRLVAVDELELREFDALKRRLDAFLDFEAKLLPTFRPAYFEYKVKFEYAGYPLVGYIDRIDVDDEGNAVVIDYKGSIKPEHGIAGKTAENMGKVQARIYAKAVEQLLGLRVVATLYMSHGKKHVLSGAYDASGPIDVGHLPYMDANKCSCGGNEEAPDPLPMDFDLSKLSFAEMLDCTERVVGAAIKNMSEGIIDLSPSSSAACAYCPVNMCPKRGA